MPSIPPLVKQPAEARTDLEIRHGTCEFTPCSAIKALAPSPQYGNTYLVKVCCVSCPAAPLTVFSTKVFLVGFTFSLQISEATPLTPSHSQPTLRRNQGIESSMDLVHFPRDGTSATDQHSIGKFVIHVAIQKAARFLSAQYPLFSSRPVELHSFSSYLWLSRQHFVELHSFSRYFGLSRHHFPLLFPEKFDSHDESHDYPMLSAGADYGFGTLHHAGSWCWVYCQQAGLRNIHAKQRRCEYLLPSGEPRFPIANVVLSTSET